MPGSLAGGGGSGLESGVVVSHSAVASGSDILAALAGGSTESGSSISAVLASNGNFGVGGHEGSLGLCLRALDSCVLASSGNFGGGGHEGSLGLGLGALFGDPASHVLASSADRVTN